MYVCQKNMHDPSAVWENTTQLHQFKRVSGYSLGLPSCYTLMYKVSAEYKVLLSLRFNYSVGTFRPLIGNFSSLFFIHPCASACTMYMHCPVTSCFPEVSVITFSYLQTYFSCLLIDVPFPQSLGSYIFSFFYMEPNLTTFQASVRKTVKSSTQSYHLWQLHIYGF